MAQMIQSPVKRWPGTVTLPDYLTFDQVQAYREAAAAVPDQADGTATVRAWLPAVCQIVQEWHLAGLPSPIGPATFPATPPRSSAQLFGWLLAAITALFDDEETIPNG